PTTLDEALSGDLLPFDFDMILVQRADPVAFLPDGYVSPNLSGLDKRQTEAVFAQEREFHANTLGELLKHLREGGYFVLTIGSGNNEMELNQRKRLLETISDLLETKMGAETEPQIPRY